MSEAATRARAREALAWLQAVEASPLNQEWLAAQKNLDEERRAMLLAVPGDTIDTWVGCAHVALDGAHRWHPDQRCPLAFITPITGADWLCLDLVAWRPETPHLWALRTGLGQMLGVLRPNVTRVTRNPYSWLKRGADGVCPVHPGARDELRDYRGELVAEDEEHRQALRDWLRGGPRVVT